MKKRQKEGEVEIIRQEVKELILAVERVSAVQENNKENEGLNLKKMKGNNFNSEFMEELRIIQ